MIPITILTGFLGSGKTTLINKIIKQNPDIRFGFIINEFGEIGIDGQLIENSGEELVEMSNGCVCCVVRKDLLDAVSKLVESKKVDYIIIETSGLAEPGPVAQSFMIDNLGGKINLDSVVCLVDTSHYEVTKESYKIAIEQLQFADIVVLNKLEESDAENKQTIKKIVAQVNPDASLLENTPDFDTFILIETGKWTSDKLSAQEEHEHEHHHEHEEVDEIVFKTDKILDPIKLDSWMQNHMDKNIVRSKGFLRLQTKEGLNTYLFQMVGAKKLLEPFVTTRKDFDAATSRLVLIGKNLDKAKILSDLEKTVI